jgi:peptide/nickel transport system substrate-binding protein
LFLLAGLGSACARSEVPAVVNDGELIIGFPEGNVGSADLGPNQFTSILSQEGLTSRANMDGRAMPRLAESWQWEKEGLRLRLKLRQGVFFHDGTPMTSNVVAGILRAAMADPEGSTQYASLVDVRAVQIDGDFGLILDLSRPSAFLIEDLIMPLRLVPEGAPEGTPSVGTGPFRVVKREPKEIVFERFDRYYEGAAAIQTVRVKTFDALRTAWSSMLRGEVDMVTDVPAEAVEFIRADNVDVLPYKRWYQYMIAFNQERAPFASPAVRRALNLAVDRGALIQRALRGYGSEATGPLWPRHWAYDPSVPSFTFDQRQAMSLLDQAGLVEGKAGAQSHVPKARFKFTCLLNGDFSLHERVGLELQKQLYDIGVDMQFEVVNLAEYNIRIGSGKFDAVLVDIISGPSYARPYLFWRSGQHYKGYNVFGYENAEAERLFSLLKASALNETATRSATHRLQRVLLEDPPALFLAWSERARVVGPKFRPESEPERDPVLSMWRWKPANVTLAAAR